MDIWWILSILVSSGIGLITAMIFNKRKKPMFFYRTRTLISRRSFLSCEPYKVLLGNEHVHESCVMLFSFWNSGKETINRSDSVVFPRITMAADTHILSASMLECTDKDSKCDAKLSEDKASVMFTYDYLDYKQGFSALIFANSVDMSNGSLQFSIKGCKKVESRKLANYKLIHPLILLLAPTVFALLVVELIRGLPEQTKNVIMMSAMGISFIVPFLYYRILTTARKHLSFPKNLKDNYKKF